MAARRLAGLRLNDRPFATWQEVVRWLGAVQSQDYPGGKWSIGQRCPGLTDANLDAALADGSLVRLHILRPTWHFVLAEDVRWLQALTGPRVQAKSGTYFRQIGLTEDILRRTDVALARALENGPLTRNEVRAALRDAGFHLEGGPLGFVLMHAELEAIAGSGPLRGNQHTYALIDSAAQAVSAEEALLELTRRYFTSHGPATPKDFRWWSSLTESDAKRALSELHAQHEQIDGVTYYWLGEQSGSGSLDGPRRVHLLQAYDEYFVGYTGETRRVLDHSLAASKRPGTSPIFSHVVLLDGEPAGRWKRQSTPQGVVVEAELFDSFDHAALPELELQVSALGHFLERPATLRVV